MKDLNNEMDELFRESLDTSAINPSPGVWNALEQRLNQQQAESKRRKRFFYLWYPVPVFVLSACVAGLFIQPSSRNISYTEAKYVSSSDYTLNPAGKNAQHQVIGSSDQKSVLIQAPATQYVSPEKIKDTSPAMQQDASVSKTLDQHIAQSKSSSASVFLIHTPTRVLLPEYASALPIAAEASSNDETTGAKKSLKEIVAKESLPTTPAENNKNPAPSGNANNSGAAADSAHVSPDQGAASGSSKLHRVSLQLFYGPEMTKRVFTKDHDSDDNLKMNDDDYKERELIGPSFSMGLKAGYDLSERWKVHVGLSYYSFSQQIQPMALFTQKGGDGANHFVLNTSAGSAELPNMGSEPGKKDSLMLNNPSSQVLHYLNIPMTIEFRISDSKRFSCYAFAGAYLSYLLDSRLVMEVTKGSATEVYTFSSLQGTNKFMLGLNAGLGAQYNLSKKISLHAEPGAKFAVSPLNSNTAVRCFPYSFALTFGLGYHF
jgi:hypothetical protein